MQRAPAERAPSLVSTLDQAHPQYGEPVRGLCSAARQLAAQLTETN
jgi:hypothetical protein